MDTEELEQFFQTQWASAGTGCMSKIKEREDKRNIRSFRNYEDIIENLINDPAEPLTDDVLRELSMIRPRLVVFRDFCQVFAERLGPRLDPSLFWGLMGTTLTVATQMEGDQDAVQRIIQVLKSLSRDVETLQSYSASQEALSNKEKETVFETFVAATNFFCDAIRFLRDEDHFARDPDPWKRLKDIFDVTEHNMEVSMKTIKEAAAMSQQGNRGNDLPWLYSMMSLNPRSWKDQATLPCIMLPPSRTSKFFDRDDVIDKIEDCLNQRSSQSFRSIALYGMAGVGKTHVAVKYAQAKFTQRKLTAVLWVEAESKMKVKQSFTDIAARLQLPGYVQHNHEDNRLLVLTWLQNTRAKWLIVYDNVESFDVLDAYWPSSAASGHALITTRNTDLAYEPADAGIEVEPWDTQTGSQFLLHLLSGHISADLLANQSKSALELSERLSGHALALARMGGVIHRRRWTIKQLVEVYDRAPEFGQNGIGPVWQLSFQNLSPHGSSLLSVISFCSADRIPETLLEPENPKGLAEELPWCTNVVKLSQAMEELQTLSLVKKDRETGALSIHRLIQTHFQEFLGEPGREEAHRRASKLVFLAFPERAPHLHEHWERCSIYVPHILALRDAFKQEKQRNVEFSACREFCEVATTCERYLLEQHEFDELKELCEVNEKAILSLKGEERLWDMRSSIPSYLGQLYLRSGFHRRGLECLQRSLKIRTLEVDGDQMEVSWSEHNLGEAYVTMMELDKAYEWLERAAATWKRWAESAAPSDPPRRPYSPFQKMSMATCLLYMGRLDEARSMLDSPHKEYMANATEQWTNAAYATFLLGRIEMEQNEFATAETYFMQAQNLWLSRDKARTSYFNGACMYRMGCCALDQGNVEAAIKHIRDAMVITNLHKADMVGEHARCLYKMSQVLYGEDGREAEAEALLQEAEALYFSRAEGDQGRTPTEKDYDGLVHLRWR